MARVGLEQDSVTNGINDGYEIGGDCVGTESGTDREFCGSNGLISDACDSDLQRVMDAWATLPETVRQDILTLINAQQPQE